MSPSSTLLTSVPHPLGRGSKEHSRWICERRTIYWWRREPHHQKSNHHWEFMFLLPFKLLALQTLLFLCYSVTSWNRKIATFHYCFLQITRKVIRRIIPQERKRDEVVIEWDCRGESFVSSLKALLTGWHLQCGSLKHLLLLIFAFDQRERKILSS